MTAKKNGIETFLLVWEIYSDVGERLFCKLHFTKVNDY